ncbi:hypothetical protein W97_07972 [Coniosporium apollinis CBS 100218]|uniref:Phosphoglycerate mutase n=1 Tax=Coniosporium apollinis (strain CBS 100218) TaxID=1168221 RepID=R7Z3W7_CONA1|nr:uncharacterized protein W97_07972 [Coniosporium apollinis CBS 100218]EON68714.1 hypothetical protein W97_07972 [Coniosporium apollinis CBS 100218]
MNLSILTFVCLLLASPRFCLGLNEGDATQIFPVDRVAPFKFTIIGGVFLQDDPATNDTSFEYTRTNLGLIDRPYPTDPEFDPEHKKTQWQRFEHYVHTLNDGSPRDVAYKVFFIGRHGQGVHNIAESYYGTPEWDRHWSKLDGIPEVTWADPELTELGILQAVGARNFWASALTNASIPAPGAYFVSPLIRCLETARLTFGALDLPRDRPFKPVVKELLREVLGVHTCDRRSSLSTILERYPDYTAEKGFTEEDELWRPDVRETDEEMTARLTKFLNDVFCKERAIFVSLTGHGGSTAAILRAVGHRVFRLQTGAVLPVLVEAESVGGFAARGKEGPEFFEGWPVVKAWSP